MAHDTAAVADAYERLLAEIKNLLNGLCLATSTEKVREMIEEWWASQDKKEMGQNCERRLLVGDATDNTAEVLRTRDNSRHCKINRQDRSGLRMEGKDNGACTR